MNTNPFDQEVANQWRNILDKDILKGSINIISLYILVYELLEDRVISLPKDFFTIIEYDEEAERKYKENVLSLYDRDSCPNIPGARKDIISSLLWFKSLGAIDDNDIRVFSESKRIRNQITHEMLKSISEGTGWIIEQFAKMYGLFCKIEKWWICEYEIPISGEYPNLSQEELDGVMSGNMMIIGIIVDILNNDSNINFKEVCELLGIPVK